jgi:hypothetical protein
VTRAVAIAALALAVCAAVAGAARAERIAYAISIGNNAPPAGDDRGLGPLRFADDDAARYHQLFRRFAVRAELLAVLDPQTQRRHRGLAAAAQAPTVANLLRVVDRYAAQMAADRARGDEPVLYLAFSGHGTRGDDGGAALALLDGGVTRELLADRILAALPAAYVHLIIDACHANAVVGVRGDDYFAREVDATTAPVAPAELGPLVASSTLARFPHVGVLLASAAGQEAHEWSEIESGVFTHEVLSALLGGADVNGDRAIEYTEVQAFAAAANRAIDDPRALPHVIARPPALDARVAIVSLGALAGTRLLRGDASGLGHFHVERANGQRYLDAHVTADAPAVFAVPDGEELFVRTATSEARLPAYGPRELAVAELRFASRAIAARGSIDAAYRHKLFASPYGPTYYKGFVDSIGADGVTFAEVAAPGASGADLRAIDTQPARDDGRARAYGIAAVAAASAAASIGTALLAVDARRDYDATELQRPARDAMRRYDRYRTLSIASGVVAVSAGVAAWWLWPDARPTVTIERGPDGGPAEYGAALELAW